MEMSRDGYRCSAGESFDKVAMDLYGDEIYAAELLCANPEYALKIVFDGTEILRLPVIDMPETEEEIISETAPWRQ